MTMSENECILCCSDLNVVRSSLPDHTRGVDLDCKNNRGSFAIKQILREKIETLAPFSPPHSWQHDDNMMFVNVIFSASQFPHQKCTGEQGFLRYSTIQQTAQRSSLHLHQQVCEAIKTEHNEVPHTPGGGDGRRDGTAGLAWIKLVLLKVSWSLVILTDKQKTEKCPFNKGHNRAKFIQLPNQNAESLRGQK